MFPHVKLVEEQTGCAAARSPRRAPDRPRAARLPPNATARASCRRAHLHRRPGARPACGQIVDCNVVVYRCAPVGGPGRRSTRPPSWSALTTVWSDQCPVLVAGSLTNCCATRGRAAQPAQPGRHAGATQLGPDRCRDDQRTTGYTPLDGARPDRRAGRHPWPACAVSLQRFRPANRATTARAPDVGRAVITRLGVPCRLVVLRSAAGMIGLSSRTC